MASEANIIHLDRAHIKKVASVLSKAFQDDPVFTYFIPDTETRRAKSHYVFETLVKYSILHGEIYATSPGFEAVAVWLPHNKVEMKFWNALRNGGLSILSHLGPVSVSRQLTTTNLMCATHKSLAPYPHQYLYLIGVEPGLQRKGYAGLLMRPMLARLDSERLPCYLDNTNEKNNAMYEHYGFKVIKEYQIPKTSVRVWAMVRKPVS